MPIELIENLEVVTVDVTKLIAGVEEALRFDRDARNAAPPDSTQGKEGTRKLVPASTEGGLTGIAVAVDDQRVQVNPATTGGHELHPVWPPIGLDDVPQLMERVENLLLMGCVDVEVDVPVRSGLAASQRIDAPTSLEPEPASDRAHGVENDMHFVNRHAWRVLHRLIVTSTSIATRSLIGMGARNADQRAGGSRREWRTQG